MSRITYCDADDTEGILQLGRWYKNTIASLSSKRGLKVLRELEAALEALPVKALYDDLFLVQPEGGQVQACAWGAVALHRGLSAEIEGWETAEWVEKNLGVAHTLAWNLIELNDERLALCSPPERYERTLAWVRRVLADPAGEARLFASAMVP